MRVVFLVIIDSAVMVVEIRVFRGAQGANIDPAFRAIIRDNFALTAGADTGNFRYKFAKSPRFRASATIKNGA